MAEWIGGRPFGGVGSVVSSCMASEGSPHGGCLTGRHGWLVVEIQGKMETADSSVATCHVSQGLLRAGGNHLPFVKLLR